MLGWQFVWSARSVWDCGWGVLLSCVLCQLCGRFLVVVVVIVVFVVVVVVAIGQVVQHCVMLIT